MVGPIQYTQADVHTNRVIGSHLKAFSSRHQSQIYTLKYIEMDASNSFVWSFVLDWKEIEWNLNSI